MHTKSPGLLIMGEGLPTYQLGIALHQVRAHLDSNPLIFNNLHCIESGLHGKEVAALRHAVMPLAGCAPNKMLCPPDELLMRLALYLQVCREWDVRELLKRGKSVFVHLPLMMIASHTVSSGIDKMHKLRNTVKRALREYFEDEELFNVDHYLYFELSPAVMAKHLLQGVSSESHLETLKEAEEMVAQMKERMKKDPSKYSVIDGSVPYDQIKVQVISVLERVIGNHYGS